MQQTPNYGLKKYDALTDYVDPTAMNENMDTIDTELKTGQNHREDATVHIGTASKTTPVDADSVALVDSADGSKAKRLSWANLKTALTSVFAIKSHSSTATTYGTGTSTNHGHVKLSDAIDSTSGVAGATAATPAAVKAAYDLAATHKSRHAAGGADALAPSDIGAAVTSTLNATLSTTWTGTSAPYTQTVSVAGILATDNPVIDVVLSSDTAASKLILEAWANVSRITTDAGSITAYCYESKPAVAIPLQLKVVR